MATEKQIAANRRNSARSTGPRSTEGKARSRMNALRHGLSYLGRTGLENAGARKVVAAEVYQGLHRVRVKRAEMMATLSDLLVSGNPDAISRLVRRISALSRYESRMYAAHQRIPGVDPD